MTEKYDSRDINVNRSPKKFFPIIGKLEKAVNRYGQREREADSTLSNGQPLPFSFFAGRGGGGEHVRLLRTAVGLFVTVIQPSANESIMVASYELEIVRFMYV